MDFLKFRLTWFSEQPLPIRKMTKPIAKNTSTMGAVWSRVHAAWWLESCLCGEASCNASHIDSWMYWMFLWTLAA